MEVLEAIPVDELHIIEPYIEFGNYVLASESPTTIYYNIKGALCDPDVAPELVQFAVKEVKELSKNKPVTIAGYGYGGALYAAKVAAAMRMPLMLFRTENREHGLRESVIRPKRFFPNVIIVDDVHTTGNTIRAISAMVEKLGAYKILGAVVAIDRQMQ